MSFDTKKAIAGLVHAVAGPLIVYETTWADTIPDWVRKHLTVARLAQQMRVRAGKEEPGLATDIETMAYLYPASMVAPMGHDWTEIYLWLCAKCMRDWKPFGKKNLGALDEIAPKAINSDQERQLKDLQRWLWGRYQALILSKARGMKDGIVSEPYLQCSFWKEEARVG